MTTLAEELFTAIAGDSAVKVVVGTRVYRTQARQATARPFIVWQTVTEADVMDLDGTPATGGLQNPRIQVTSWAEKSTDADALDRLVRAAMAAASAFKSLKVDHRDLPFEPDTRLYGSQTDFSLWRST